MKLTYKGVYRALQFYKGVYRALQFYKGVYRALQFYKGVYTALQFYNFLSTIKYLNFIQSFCYFYDSFFFIVIDWLSLVSLFNGISTVVGYLMPKPFSKKNSSGTI